MFNAFNPNAHWSCVAIGLLHGGNLEVFYLMFTILYWDVNIIISCILYTNSIKLYIERASITSTHGFVFIRINIDIA